MRPNLNFDKNNKIVLAFKNASQNFNLQNDSEISIKNIDQEDYTKCKF